MFSHSRAESILCVASTLLKYRADTDLWGYCAIIAAKTVLSSAVKYGSAVFLLKFNLFFILKGISMLS